MNRGALAGGAPDGAPALGAEGAEYSKDAQSYINLAHEFIDPFDDKLLETFESIGRGWPPDDMLMSDAFWKRLLQTSCYEIVEIEPGYREARLRTELTQQQVNEIHAICKGVRAWAVDEASPPDWALDTIRRRNRFIAEAAKEAGIAVA